MPTSTPRSRDRAGLLFVLVAAWALVPKVVQTVTAPKYRVRVDEAEPPPTAYTSLATDLLTVALLGLCLLLVLDGLRRNPRRGLPGVLLLLAPWAWVQVRGLTLDLVPGVSDLVYPAVVVAVWVVRPGLAHLRLLGYLAGAVAVVSVAVGVLLPDKGLFRALDGNVITQEKALLPEGILVGIFTHGNTLGQYLLLGLPLIALVPRPVVRTVLLAAAALALVWSAARSSVGGAVALALVAVVLSLLPAARRAVPGRLVVWAALGLVVLLPFLTTTPGAFTNRGGIWAVSLAHWRDHPWVGNGADFYTRIAQTTGDLGGTVFHGHNEVVQLLVTGGVVLAVLTGLLVLAAVHRATRTPRGVQVGVALALSLAGASLLEVSLQFEAGGVFLPVLLLPLATLLVGEPLDAEPVEHLRRPAATARAVAVRA